MGLADFYKSLGLQVAFRPAAEKDLDKVSYLTNWTADFHLTAQGLTREELERLLESGTEIWVVEVSDRFGDYGLTGTMLFRKSGDVLDIESYILSCKILGKNVETTVLSQTLALAQVRGCTHLALHYRKTPRNGVSADFVKKTGRSRVTLEEGGFGAVVPLEEVATVLAEQEGVDGAATAEKRSVDLKSVFGLRRSGRSTTDLWSEISTRFQTGTQILEGIREWKQQTGAQRERSYTAPRTLNEETLVHIYEEVLNINPVGIMDHFLELGGHSLIATQLLSRIRECFGVELPLRAVFDYPTIAALAERLEGLEGKGKEEQTGIPRRSGKEKLPLSNAQQRLWFLDQLEPGSPYYNMCLSVRLKGPLSVEALERSIQSITDRHEMFRTTFPLENEQPVQWIAPSLEVALIVEDLTPFAETNEAVEAVVREETRRPFDLSNGPLLRAKLLRTNTEEHLLLLTMHHIVSDGWSLGVMQRELEDFYVSFTSGRESDLPGLDAQYADYVLWQRERMQDGRLEPQLAYWTKQLGDIPPLLLLPTDRPRPAVQTFEGATLRRMVPAQIARELDALCRREGVTLFMASLAVFQVLLHRYTGQETIVVGSPVANRQHKQAEDLIGFFVNTLALRGDLTGNLSFREFLHRMRVTALDAYEHQDLPFDQLVEALNPERTLSATPIFQVTFALQNAAASSTDADDANGICMSFRELDNGTSKFDMSFTLEENAQGLEAVITYNTDLFDSTTIERMHTHYQLLLEAVARDTAQPIGKLKLLPEEEYRQVVGNWNATRTSYPTERGAHELVADFARREPGHIAVHAGGKQYTYGELNTFANQLAHALRERGVGSGDVVGLYIERSYELIAAELAVLKAGAAYLPIDTAHPPERVAYMLGDSGASVLLTLERLLPQLSGLSVDSTSLLCLDRERERLANYPDVEPELVFDPSELAYVIYTSGSTGQPKGVEVRHRGLLNLVFWHRSAYSITPDDRATLLAGTSFDASVWELWPYLTAGASVYVVDDETRLDALKLRDWYITEGITVSFVPTPLAETLLTLEWPSRTALRYMLTGGDRLRVAPPEGLAFRLVNHYGPTESTVVTTSGEIHPEAGGSPTIGRPIANIQVYLLDAHMQPVPVGVQGEMYIGGDGLARGYRNRADLTAERFVPHPFVPGEFVYKTGDVCRFLPDGSIEFVGRADFQVKIRGYRIELGEIETLLSGHPAVRQAIVLVRQDRPGEQRLVAYIVGQEGQADATVLRGYLKDRLPGYMVPSAFIDLEEFPLTPNGKIDSRALPAPDLVGAGEGEDRAPQNETEETLLRIWRQVLGMEHIGVHSNFFDLGGDSIQSIQIVARASAAGIRLTTKQMFRDQTVAELAAAAGTSTVAEAEQGLVTGDVAFTPIQKWLLEQKLVGLDHWNMAMKLTLKMPADTKALEEAFSRLLEHHDALRLRYQQTEFGWRQMNEKAVAAAPMRIVELGGLAQTAREKRVREATLEAQSGLDLAEGPLLRTVLFRYEAGQPEQLLIVLHHFVIDGVSWRILLEDLETVYRQVVQGEAVSLPAKTTSFRKWADLLVEYAQNSELRTEATYWLAEDTGSTAERSLELAIAKNSRAKVEASHTEAEIGFNPALNTVGAIGQVTVTLDAERTRQMLQDAPKAYRTYVNDILLTALARAVSGLSGSRRLLVALEGHGREEIIDQADISRTVGWFTSLYPVRLDLGRIHEPGAELKAVKEQLRQIPNRGIGYGLLRYLSGDAELAAALGARPEPEISFNYLGQFDQIVSGSELFGLKHEAIEGLRSPLGRRRYALDVFGLVVEGKLEMTWEYSEALHDRETVRRLAESFAAELTVIIGHCLSPGACGWTPSDFLAARLTQDELDEIVRSHPTLEDVHVLSPLQQGMLFHALYSPESTVYFEQALSELKGELNEEAFIQAWHTVLGRHSILRSSFIWEGVCEPHQIVHRDIRIPVSVVDIRGLAEEELASKLEELLEQDRQQKFDLRQSPLMRLKLVQLTDDRTQLVWSFHHILLDGWSVFTILREVFEAYAAWNGGSVPEQAPAVSYRDYITWCSKQNLSEAEAYWRESLRQFIAPTALQIDRTQQAEERYEEQRILILNENTNKLQKLAKARHVTLNTLIQAAWGILLSRYSGEDDVLFGATVSVRPPELRNIESMVGLFINSLPVRIRISQEAELLTWLEELQERQMDWLQYAHTPLTLVNEWSDVPKGTPLFESLLVFENYPIAPTSLSGTSGIQAGEVRILERTTYPLTLIVIPGESLEIRAIYDQRRFDDSAIERMLGHLRTLLGGFVAAAGGGVRQVKELPLLSETELRMLREWNAQAKALEGGSVEPAALAEAHAGISRQTAARGLTGVDASARQPNVAHTIHQLIEQQALRTPDATALIAGEERLTYHELDQRSNQLAAHLRMLGVGPEFLIGVFMERTAEIVVALLAVFKAGGAYVPLDPNYPQDRIGFMLEDTGLKVLLTQKRLVERLPNHQAVTVCVDQDWEQIGSLSGEPVHSGVSERNLAYVIYTSGSTGRPKGVALEHRNTVAFFRWCAEVFTSEELAGVLASTSISFDLSVFELFFPLTRGGKVILMENALQLIEQPAEAAEVTLINSVPSAMAELLRMNAIPSSVVTVNLAGEPLPLVLAHQVYGTGTVQKLYNLYGPSEDTTYSTWSLVPKGSQIAPDIGRPITGTRSYLLDSHLRPVPIGVPGELFLAGEGLARGYLYRPDLTNEKFIPDPFVDEPRERMYRTGDLCRYRPDGVIEYLGRIDQQVKVRGFRIELGEVETALSLHPEVREAVAMVREDVPGQKWLAAYIVLVNSQAVLTADSLREHLKQRLPDYMVPSAFVTLAALPLTPNGKVDRKGLPAPERFAANKEGYEAPRNEIEELLSTIWAQVLGLERVGIKDGFFDLGGDSILSIQIISRAAQAGIKLTPKQLFRYQTIAEVAAVAQVSTASVTAQQGEITGAAPLTPIQRWFFESDIPNWSLWNQVVHLTLHAPLSMDLLREVITGLLRHHDGLRLRFTQNDSVWTQEYAAYDGEMPLTELDLSDLPQEKRQEAFRAAVTEQQTSLNVDTGPLVRFLYFHMGAGAADRLTIIVHHLASDGISLRVLLDDTVAAYAKLSRGEMLQLPPKQTSYGEWASRLEQYAASPIAHEERAYWLQPKRSASLPLPTDHDRGGNSLDAVRQVTVSLTSEDTRRLLQEVPSVYHTEVNDVLLTALLQVFVGWTGQSSLLVNMEGHGREDLFEGMDVSRTVGWFTSLYPVYLELEHAASPGTLLKSVKEQLRAVPHRGIGYGILRYLSGDPEVESTMWSQPEADVIFNYLGQFDQLISGSEIFETVELEQRLNGNRRHLLDVYGMVSAGELRMVWEYSDNLHTRETIQRLAESFITALRELIAHCLSPEAGGYTPSDFPLARLTQNEIDRFIGSDPSIEDVYLLSDMQQGMLFHTITSPESGMYFENMNAIVEGPFEPSDFEKAWQSLVDRHAILRTGFLWNGLGVPHQIVYRDVHLPLWQEDWTNLSETEQEDRLQAFLAEEKRRGFKLEQPPLMKVALFRTSKDMYRMVWSFHHLLLDGWSVSKLLQQFFCYFSPDRAKLSVSGRSYRDYIEWLQARDAKQAEAYWRELLKGFSAPTPLVVKLAQPGSEPGHEELRMELPGDLTARLQEVAKRIHVTLNTLVQGVWSLLLSRYSGEEDVVFGATYSGRSADLPNIEDMVGLFINTLPVRVKLTEDAGLFAWLQELQDRQAEQQAYESTPLSLIQNVSEVQNGISLFASILVFENYPVDAWKSVDGTVNIHSVRTSEQTNYDLTIAVVPGEELSLRALFARAAFETEAVWGMLKHLRGLLEGVAEANDRSTLKDLRLLTAPERQELLDRASGGTAQLVTTEPIHERVQKQASLTPDAVAVLSETGTLTYGELNAKANRLARHLRNLGVGPDVLVGVCTERSPEMLVGLLGILKAGGAYVPVDPAYPPERIKFILEDTSVPVLLTQQKLRADLPQLEACVLNLDADLPEIFAESADDLESFVQAGNLAYVIYTSGSTGRPKGVEVTHGALLNLVKWHCEAYTVTQADRATLIAGTAFDASVWEVWPYLASGAGLYVPSEEARLMPEALRDWLVVNGITLSFLPTPLAERIIMLPWPEETALRALLTGGDKLHRHPGAKLPFALMNHYGPTENTVVATYGEVPVLPGTEASPTIGRPITNVSAYILDRNLELVPVGVPGELYIGGASLARGYWNRPDLTEERFVHDPFAGEAGARMYRTGDLCRYRADGEIEYIGRTDDQVKIRGFRIELGEVETAVSLHPGVREAVVVVREDTPGQKRLVAYVVPTAVRGADSPIADPVSQAVVMQQPEPQVETGEVPVLTAELRLNELRSRLKERLPDYMVPSAFVMLEALPLTPNGKVDRRALPAPVWTEETGEQTEPRNDIEITLSAIWAQVLGLERVGIHDNFFELGGDSILAIQIVSRSNQEGLHLMPKQLFDYPTVAELADVAGEAEAARGAEQGEITGEAPLTPIQSWFFAQDISDRHHWNQAMLLAVRKPLPLELAQKALNALAAHHDALRFRYVNTSNGWEQSLTPAAGFGVPLAAVDLSTLDDEEQIRALEAVATEAQAGMSLEEGRLVRAVLFNLGREQRLLLAIHHMVVDGVSWRILLEDLETVCGQLSEGAHPVLPAKTTSFKHWAEALAEYAQTDAMHAELDIWLHAAERSSEPLPYDHELGPNSLLSTDTVITTLSAEETEVLLKEVPGVFRTEINDVLLTALVQAISVWTGEKALSVTLEGHGREDLIPDTDLSRTVGWFTSMFPVHLSFSGAENTAGRLKAVKEQLRAIPNRGVGYGLLRWLSADEKVGEQLTAGPVPDISFNYLGQFDQMTSQSLWFGPADEPVGKLHGQGERQHVLDIVSVVNGGRLTVSWTYSRNLHTHTKVEWLAEEYLKALRAIIAASREGQSTDYTPADFRRAKLNQQTLDKIMNQVAGRNRRDPK